jgi:hypothetical protein
MYEVTAFHEVRNNDAMTNFFLCYRDFLYARHEHITQFEIIVLFVVT